MKKLVFATHNQNKLAEIQALVGENIQLLSLNDIDFTEEIEENGKTIEENAIIKAQYIKEKYGYDVFADDTGLEVSALANQPGVHSARYAGNEKNDKKNIELLLKNLKGITNREARFKTIIALCWKNELYTFEGIAQGTITTQPIGENGFGYDPVFQPISLEKTFAQLSQQEKNEISHRGKAFAKLLHFLHNIS